MEICLECNQSFESKSKLSYHIFHTHNLTSKMYYDKHLKKDNDGICLNCGRPTLFKNLVRGYKKSCCKECERKCAEITNKERYGYECYYIEPGSEHRCSSVERFEKYLIVGIKNYKKILNECSELNKSTKCRNPYEVKNT